MGFGAVDVSAGFFQEAEVVRKAGDVDEQRGLVFFEMIDGVLPINGGALGFAEGIERGAEARVEAADLVVAVRAVVELVDGLAIVVARGFVAAEVAEDFGADLQSRGEGIDAVEIGAESLLGFLNGGTGGVESFLQISRTAEGINAVPEDADECGGR